MIFVFLKFRKLGPNIVLKRTAKIIYVFKHGSHRWDFVGSLDGSDRYQVWFGSQILQILVSRTFLETLDDKEINWTHRNHKNPSK